jgi:O-acetyl-ADP-ribose deacetylase (regulator of RNase III)
MAFPNISTGIYHFPKKEAAQIAFGAVSTFLAKHAELEKIIFVCFDDENYALYNDLL